jgi:hypothetical protein
VRALQEQGVHADPDGIPYMNMPTDGWLPWTALPEDAVLDIIYLSNVNQMQLPNGNHLFDVGGLKFSRTWTARIGVRTATKDGEVPPVPGALVPEWQRGSSPPAESESE